MARVISSTAGTRSEPKDGYRFVRGTTATFKIIFTNNGVPTKADTNTTPIAVIYKPAYLNNTGSPIQETVATLTGYLTAGQEFEYSFDWAIPADIVCTDEYIIRYTAQLGSVTYNFGDEFFEIQSFAGSIGTKQPSYATVDDVRKKKFNIDDYLPSMFKKDLDTRNQLIEDHLYDAAQRLREELATFKQRGNTENYRLFCVYYTVWSILLASRGEDGSSVSSENLTFWRSEWERILAQEKRQSTFQGIPIGRG
ncbi:MAG TPA: hypothetical protein VIL57_10585 [Bacteroidia bacterium]